MGPPQAGWSLLARAGRSCGRPYAYPDLHVEPLEIRCNGDRVSVWVRFTGHRAGRGAAMEMELAPVVTLEDGKLRRGEEYSQRAEALAAIGLAEQTQRVLQPLG